MVYTLLSSPMVHTLFPCFPRKMVSTTVFLLCDLGSDDRLGEEECHGGGVYSEGQKHVTQPNKSQEFISPNMSSQFQLWNSPELNSYFNWEMSTGRFSGISPWVLFWGVPQFSGGEISTKKFLRMNFWNMSSHIQLKNCFGINFDLISTFTVLFSCLEPF